MKKLIETIVSEVVNTLNKKGYSTNDPGSGIVAERSQGMCGSAGGQGKGRGGRGQGGGGRGAGRGGGSCGGGGGRGNGRTAG